MNQKPNIGRRSFLKKSIATAVAAPALVSMEERLLVNSAMADEVAPPVQPIALCKNWTGKIGKVEISRLICGGNLISGYGHSRDLIYVSNLLKHYFTDEKIIATWKICEQLGVNTMVAYPGDPNAIRVYKKYREEGGKIQYLAQINPVEKELDIAVKQAVFAGASGAFLVGNLGDLWSRDGKIGVIGELIKIIKDNGLIAGCAGHELRTPMAIEQAGIAPDFYVKTLHNTNYWSTRRPDQTKDVIDNYGCDNYWCKEPKEVIDFMSKLKRPWIAYKVLAAGAVHPRDGFKYAYENGADFALVGMFDFQVHENITIANRILSGELKRSREWMA
ncbi:MAG: hypothetical protein ABSH20_10325 [Tepidisphaeraceae bacterium]|jgi:hypothetical protein